MQKKDRMDYEEFKEAIQADLEGKLGKECTILIQDVPRNNGGRQSAVTILVSNTNIAPRICLDGHYEKYLEGRNSEQVVEDILKVHEQYKVEEKVDTEWFFDYQFIKERIAYRLVNYEQNMEMLQDMPHKRILDLAIVFYILLDKHDMGAATIMIQNNHLDMWRGVTVDEIYQAALENTPVLLPVKIESMASLLGGMMQELAVDFNPGCKYTTMYVITNKFKMNGAACILYDDVLKQFADFIGSNLFIIPSSIHECIIVPDNQGGDLKETNILYQDMIKDVNKSTVSEVEILGYNPFYYDKSKDEIMLINGIMQVE